MTAQVRRGGESVSDRFLLRLTGPILRGASGLTTGISRYWSEYVDLRGARRRNAELNQTLAELQVELQRLEEARVQNERLRQLLDMKQGMDISMVAAAVIANNSTGVSHTILVDRGSGAGVAPNSATVAARGVVGRVWTVTRNVSKVQLITDAAAGTAVLVQRTRVQGILLGRGSDLCKLEYVSTLDDVEKGDLLITSGLDGIYPKGLPVGTVVAVSPGADGLRNILVKPRVRFNRLEEALILLGNEISLSDASPDADEERP